MKKELLPKKNRSNNHLDDSLKKIPINFKEWWIIYFIIGYIDSTSFPGTPAPSPFCASPGQIQVFCPDQVVEGIQRLRQEEIISTGGAVGGYSGTSSEQPPTPSTTPGPGSAPVAHNFLGIIPELLQESLNDKTDEGLDSNTSSPATPIQTPHSPILSQQVKNLPLKSRIVSS